jgi:hypothetical protein
MSYFNSISQNSIVDSVNSNSSTLGASLTWNAAGTGVSTLGFQGIQIIVTSTQNMTLKVEQGITNSTFQVTDTYPFNTITNNFSITIKIVSLFVRVSITNNGATTATYSVNTLLTPITEPLPRSSDVNINGEHLKVGVYELSDQWGDEAHISPSGWLDVNQPYRLVGTTFGASIDTSFWTATNNGTASASGVANSIATITSGTGTNGWAQLFTVRSARFVFNNAMKSRQLILIPTVTVANTNRYWGAFTATAGSAGVLPTTIDGYYFALNGSGVLSVNSRNAGGTVNSIASGSFNGELSQYTIDTNVHVYEIVYLIAKVQFFIDDVLIHTFIPTTTILSSTQTLLLGAIATTSATNSGSIQMWAGTIHRLGRDKTAPKWIYIHGAVTAQVLKIGAGNLHSIIDNGGTGTSITLYDAVTTTNTIAIINPRATSMYSYNLDFYTGLTITTVGGTTDITVVFE